MFRRLRAWWRQRRCPHPVLELVGQGMRGEWSTSFIWRFEVYRCGRCGKQFEADVDVVTL